MTLKEVIYGFIDLSVTYKCIIIIAILECVRFSDFRTTYVLAF